MVEPILVSPIFTDFILPFILVFTLVFAVLQKTQLLGDSKKQIDAIMGLVIGLILISFPFSRDVIVLLMPFLAVSLVTILVFMLIFGFVYQQKGENILDSKVKIALGIIFSIAIVLMLLFATGWWSWVKDLLFSSEGAGQIWINILLIGVIVAAIIGVLSGNGGNSPEGG